MREPRLVLFTRYPVPGRAKTRLIPALGPEGAAALHRRLAERTLATLRATGLPIELRVTGAPPEAFRRWFGTGDEAIVDQGDGDLGARLRRAAAEPPVILLGTDTPDLSASQLLHAAALLRDNRVALGPAADGGYWLLGLPTPTPHLFDDMPWSTDAVCAVTIRRLAEHGITPVLLEELHDLDRPDDLVRWPGLVE